MKHMIFLELTIINRNIATPKMKRHNSTPKLPILQFWVGVKQKFEFLWNFLNFSVCLLENDRVLSLKIGYFLNLWNLILRIRS